MVWIREDSCRFVCIRVLLFSFPIQFRFTYGNNPCNPPSRPTPDSLYPPKGDDGSNLLYVLAQITPARSLLVTLKIFEPLSVHTPPDSPYGVLLAFSIASSTVRNVCTASTGPKISSCTTRCDCEQPRNSVGRHQ